MDIIVRYVAIIIIIIIIFRIGNNENLSTLVNQLLENQLISNITIGSLYENLYWILIPFVFRPDSKLNIHTPCRVRLSD